MNRTGSDAHLPRPMAWSTTVEDWGVKDAAVSNEVAGRPDAVAVSLVEMIIQEVTGSLERGDTVRLSSFASSQDAPSSDPNTGPHVVGSPDREMLFKPAKMAG